ncbi:MAG: VWA domain-containing protein [Candidatus Margulisiibacteriota bacterium]
MLRFEDPLFLLALFPVLGLAYLRWRHPKKSVVLFSSFSLLGKGLPAWPGWLEKAVPILRFLVLCCMVIALARPQKIAVLADIQKDGIDMVLALDVSASMRAEDFKPDNRLEVAKRTLKAFIQKRQYDRMGLVVFGEDAFTQCPLTLDYDILSGLLDHVTIGMAGGETAIGTGLATALNRLKDSPAKSKVIILLTDGVNNRGDIDPITAAGLAQDLGVKVYTIGVGKEGGAPLPVMDPLRGKVYATNPDGSLVKTQIDEATLKTISKITQGRYFRAVDTHSLETICAQIDGLEKTKLSGKHHQDIVELFPIFVVLALGLFLLEGALVFGYFGRGLP